MLVIGKLNALERENAIKAIKLSLAQRRIDRYLASFVPNVAVTPEGHQVGGTLIALFDRMAGDKLVSYTDTIRHENCYFVANIASILVTPEEEKSDHQACIKRAMAELDKYDSDWANSQVAHRRVLSLDRAGSGLIKASDIPITTSAVFYLPI